MNELEAVRRFEAEAIREIPSEERPVYHLTPAAGWLNDPNGFCFYDGRYRLHYQYNPYAPRWDAHMRWGSWSSEDLIHWQYEKAAFVPDRPYETGIYSGSAIQAKDGRLLVMYTAHREEMTLPRHKVHESQCIAVWNGSEYEKAAENPVIDEDNLPADCAMEDFRDPKIWIEGGTYYCIAANRRASSRLGRLFLFRSADALRWQYVSTLLENDGSLGRMWECPDAYRLRDKTVIACSVMAYSTTDPRRRNGYTTAAFIGDLDLSTGKFVLDSAQDAGLSELKMADRMQQLDLGFDFYAPQTMEAPDGRRILVGWMQAPEAGGNAPETAKWYGQMTFPREVSYDNGWLCQKPIDEIQKLYTDTCSASAVIEGENIHLDGVRGRTADITVEAENLSGVFEMRFAEGEGCGVSLSYDPESGELTVDRSRACRSSAICDVRRVKIEADRKLSIRLLLDRYSFEIFLNQGRHVLSGTLYELPHQAEGIRFSCRHADVRVCVSQIAESPIDSSRIH